MKTKKAAQNRAYKVIVAIVGAFFVANCISAIMLMMSLRSLEDVDPMWYLWFAGQLLPVVMFALLWAAAKGTQLERLYQAALLSLVTAIFSSLLQIIILALPMVFLNFTEPWVSNAVISGLPLVLNLLLTIIFAVVLKRQAKVKKALHFVVTMVVVAVVAFFLVSVAQTAYYAIMQYPDNPNLSSFVSSFIAYGIAAVIFAVTYVLEKRRGADDTFRRSVTISTMGLLAAFAALQLGGTLSFVDVGLDIVTTVSIFLLIGSAVFYIWIYRTLRLMK